MCGLCGEFRFDGAPADVAGVARMSAALAHRGPDDTGSWAKGPIALGHRRLAIIDLSSAGRQPMWTADCTLCIVYNGEVYNYREIRKDLLARGYRFRTDTDTEVVVEAIHCWGVEDAVRRFIGMFAFAVWHEREHRLTLCRDRAGIKPLYYYVADGLVRFASEIKALLADPVFRREINGRALAQHMITGYALGSHTVFQRTHKVPPAHIVSFDADGRSARHRYWNLSDFERGSYRGTFADAISELNELCNSAFAYRLIADVPVGMFFSGGVDSSLVSAVLKKSLGADICNITIGFEDRAYDESPRARRISAALGTRHIVHRVSAADMQRALFDFVDIFDEPFGDTSGIPTSILSRVARQHVKVALSADGGDEQFGGYESYVSYGRRFAHLMKLPVSFRLFTARVLRSAVPDKAIVAWLQGRLNGRRYRPQFRAAYDKLLRLMVVSEPADLIQLMYESAWPVDSVRELLTADAYGDSTDTVLSGDLPAIEARELLDAMMRTDFTAYLEGDILVKVDRASMAASLECRDPLLDHRITEFAARLPLDFLIGHGQQKRLLRAALDEWVPPGLLDGRKKGFVIPLYYWMKSVWKPIVLEYLSRSNVTAVGLLNPAKVESEVKEFYEHEGGRAERIWAMLNLQMWAERWYC